MKLIVMIPARNEAKSIAQVIRNIPRKIDGIAQVEVLVTDDYSQDRTIDAARKAGADYILKNKSHLGLALTFQKNINKALAEGADIIVNTDADDQYDQTQIADLIRPVLKGEADIVIGDRQVDKLDFMKPGNKYGNLLGSWVIRKLTGIRINDASSGFRAYSREAALRLNVHFNHTYTHETLIQAAFNDVNITQVPINFKPRQAGKSKLIAGLFSHIKKSFLIIVRTILLYKPLKTLFYLSLTLLIPGFLLGLRFVYFYTIGQGNGKIQSLILASMLIMLGFFLIFFGLIGDLIARNRKLNEHILYRLKKMKND